MTRFLKFYIGGCCASMDDDMHLEIYLLTKFSVQKWNLWYKKDDSEKLLVVQEDRVNEF